VPRVFVSPLERAKESFLSPAKAGSQMNCDPLTHGSKPWTTVLTAGYAGVIANGLDAVSMHPLAADRRIV
jgi:hypothetical protein